MLRSLTGGFVPFLASCWIGTSCALSFAGMERPDRAAGLCAASETVYFSCQTGTSRWLSLCGAPGQLQYRFGRQRHVELRYPEAPSRGLEELWYSHYFREQVERTEVRFETRETTYVLFDYRGSARRSAGVRIMTSDSVEHELHCRGLVHSRVDELKTLLRCDADSALNGGRCP